MNDVTLPVLIVGLTSLLNLVLGIVGLVRNPRGFANWVFFVLTVLCAAWIPANYFSSVVTEEQLVGHLVRADFAIGLLLANALLIFANSVGGRLLRNRLLLGLTLPASALIGGLVYTDLVVALQLMADGVEVIGGPASPLYELFVYGYTAAALVLLVIKARQAKAQARVRLIVVLLGVVAMVVLPLAANLVLPKLVVNLEAQIAAQRLSYLGFVLLNMAGVYGLFGRR